ncbi:uncharacterized protein ALTATR162_LOCUS7031 [Alternaria atra]|uniref:Metalloendopeptidase n=1 Tax=Alternaria atra TaxID=119953 RepID=A0A8J2N350_9PLEO|nr:uncharacterized protein ALTATR162_LOCUS7031 [Alternaria atra]CAG5169352.1 unnamed protein product [Alternaria atra]
MYPLFVPLTLLSAVFSKAVAYPKSVPGPHTRKLVTVDIQIAPSIPHVMTKGSATTSPATERVSYFVADGLAITNGDIIYSTEDDIIRHMNAQKRSLSYFKWDNQSLWPAGRIEYKWQSEHAKGLGRLEAWQKATKRWTNMLPFLQFIEHPANDILTNDIVTLVPTEGQGACFSPIGRAQGKKANRIMLDDDCGGVGTYTHELGHTLGLYHEHTRPDRDDYVIINCNNVMESSDGTEADWSGPYDSLSIMHYSPDEFANGNGPAIEARSGVATPRRHTFPTAQDAKRICRLYEEQCNGVCGDGVTDPGNGEECDDGNNFDGDGCSSSCTNGKGSICQYASSLLEGRGLKVGKFTSPHLVDRWDCISINGKPVEEKTFRKVEKHFLKINASREIGASPFEILTAIAFTIFNDANVDVGVVEVGMGGRLDSTNILNNQAISVISKIARDHESFLGNTLAEIAFHKAGILRPNVPYLINPANQAGVVNVIKDYATEIGAGPYLSSRSFNLENKLYGSSKWNRIRRAMASFQEENVKMAVVAVMQTLASMEQAVEPVDIANSLLANVKVHHGRLENVQVPPIFSDPAEGRNGILVDGAHNPDAAIALDDFVRDNLRLGNTPSKDRPQSGWPVTWVLAMSEGKDAREYLAKLLKPDDKVVTTTFGPVDGMPWVKPMDPRILLEIAKSAEPQITGVHVPIPGALRALSAAKYMSQQLAPWAPIVLTGSLYLAGDFHRELRPRCSKTWCSDNNEVTAADREALLKMQAQECERVSAVLNSGFGLGNLETEEQSRQQDEIDVFIRKV